jgi:DNA-binding MarR family transcriptional regulator
MLTVLTENPGGAGIRELAFQLGTDHSTTADVARRLARRGYIKQHIPKTDRRKIVSRITPEGRAFLKRNDAPMQRSQDILLQPLPPKQRIALMSALRTLVHHYNDKGRARLQL